MFKLDGRAVSVGSSFARLRCWGFSPVKDPFPTGQEEQVHGFGLHLNASPGGGARNSFPKGTLLATQQALIHTLVDARC